MQPEQEPSLEVLARRAGAGDRAALAAVVERLQHTVYRLALRFLIGARGRRGRDAGDPAGGGAEPRPLRGPPAYPGLLGVTLVRLETTPERTVWMDVALWDSEEQAKAAAAHCATIPEFAAMAALITEELGLEHGSVIEVR